LFPGNPASKRKGFALAQRAIRAAQALFGQRLELVALWGIAPQHVPRTMNACDAMLMTSWLEGSPNVVKEALACNLPVVSVPVGDVADLLRGLEGYAVCRRDPTAIGQALVHILARARRGDGRSALRRRRLDLDSVALRIIGLYDQILARGRPATRPGPVAKI
jgi:glycosyltransferase involved in cell wall biosynthesis